MDIPALKQQARTLEQQGSVDDALEVYRQVLAELEAIGGLRQELPLLIKIGDLLVKAGDLQAAVEMYERAAGEYATQGAAQPVISLCGKVLRVNPQDTGVYLRLARRLLDAGYVEGARQVLVDYAQRGQLDKTREGLERLAGRPEDDVRRLLDKAIFAAERRLAERPAPAPPPGPDEEPIASPEPEPDIELDLPGPSSKRITVPVGALDLESIPDVREAPPREPEVALPMADELEVLEERKPPRGPRPHDDLPSAKDLQAPVQPTPSPPPPKPPPAPPPPPAADLEPPEPPPSIIEPVEPEALGIDTSVAPPARGTEPALERPQLPPDAPVWAPEHEGAHHEAPPPPEPPPPPPRVTRPQPHVSGPHPRVSGPQPRVSGPHPRLSDSHPRISAPHGRPSAAMRAPVAVRSRRPARRTHGRWRPLLVVLVLAAGAVLVWRGITPADRLRHLFGAKEAEPPARAGRGGDSVMARDTAGFARRVPARPAPQVPFAPRPVEPQVPLVLPAGVALTRTIYVVQGLHIESVLPDSSEGVVGYRIVQVLPSGQRVVLEELPSDTLVAGEIGVTGIDPDTVVGHTGADGLAVTLKGVLSETMVVQLLQQLVPIGP